MLLCTNKLPWWRDGYLCTANYFKMFLSFIIEAVNLVQVVVCLTQCGVECGVLWSGPSWLAWTGPELQAPDVSGRRALLLPFLHGSVCFQDPWQVIRPERLISELCVCIYIYSLHNMPFPALMASLSAALPSAALSVCLAWLLNGRRCMWIHAYDLRNIHV